MAERALATAFVNIVPGTKAMEQYLRGELPAAGAATGDATARQFSAGFGSKLKGYIAPIAAGFAASFAAVGVTQFFKDAITGATDFNEQGAAVGQVFGKASADIQKFAASGAKSLGQSKVQVLDAAKQFGIYGKAAGLAGQDNAKFSTGLVGLATDLASFNNTSVDEAIQAIGSGLRGEAEPLRKFGVLLDDATLRSKALEMGLVKTTKDALSPQNKVLAANAVIFEQTKTQQGDFARTSEGLANQQRILTAQFENVKISIGTALLPAMTNIVTFVNETLIPALKDAKNWFNQNKETIGNVAGALLIILAPAIITATVTAVTNFAMQAIAAVTSAATQVAAAYRTVGGWIAMGAAALVQGARIVAGWVVASAGAIANAAVFMAQVARVVAGWVLMGVQALAQAARMAAAWFIALGPVGWVTAAVIGLVALIIANWDKVSKFTSEAWSAVSKWVKESWTKVTDAVKTGVGNVVDFVKDLPDKIKSALANAGTWLVSVGKNIMDGLLNGLKDAWNAVMDWARNIANGLSDTFKKVLGIKSPSRVFKSHGENIGIGLVDGMDSMQGAVEKSARELGSYANKGFEMSLKELSAAGSYGTLAGTKFFKATSSSDIASMLAQGGVLDVNGVTMADLKAAISSDAAGNEKLAKDAKKSGQSYYANPALMALLEKAGYSMKEWSVLQEGEMLQDLTNRLQGGFTTNYTDASGRQMSTGSTPIMELTSEALNSKNNPLLAGTKFDAISTGSIQTFIDKQKATLAEAAAWGGSNSVLTPEYLATVKADLAKAEGLLPKLAKGGYVNRPTKAIIGEAGPEVITPLKDFERMFFGRNRKRDEGMMHITYNAAPNQSLDAEQALFRAMKRAKVVSGW